MRYTAPLLHIGKLPRRSRNRSASIEIGEMLAHRPICAFCWNSKWILPRNPTAWQECRLRGVVIVEGVSSTALQYSAFAYVFGAFSLLTREKIRRFVKLSLYESKLVFGLLRSEFSICFPISKLPLVLLFYSSLCRLFPDSFANSRFMWIAAYEIFGSVR